MDQTLINRIVEATLLASSQPVSLPQLRDLFPEDQPPPNGAIEAALAHLQADCESRGVELVEVASGFRYQVRGDVHAWVARLWTERQTRYTRATLETLALIAYRQPITRGEIEQVRGVSVSSNTIKALEEREWIRVVGHRDVPGRPALFGTTKTFLDYFGLKRLDELPPLSELKDIGELEPQLQFDADAGVAARIAAAGLVDPSQGEGATDDASTAASDDDAQQLASVSDGAPADDASVDVVGTGIDDDAETGDSDTPDLDFRSERPVVFEDDEDEDHAFSGHADGESDPEAAPGTRAATENETGSESYSSATEAITAFKGKENDSDPVSNAVETTTVPALTTASDDAAESHSND